MEILTSYLQKYFFSVYVFITESLIFLNALNSQKSGFAAKWMQLAAPRLNIQKTHTSFFPKVFPLERHETEKYPDLSDLQAIYHTCPSFC